MFPVSNGIGAHGRKEGALMNQTTDEPLQLRGEELAMLSELLESAHANLLI